MVTVRNKKLAKNTIYLYVRMFFMMLIMLYTARLLLNVLGVEDYGIYNIVGGIVALFMFVNQSLINSIQRFLNYELGREDKMMANKVFSMGINACVIVALVFVFLSETLGLWFLYRYINIPEDRFFAATVVYHLSVLGAVFNILKSPFLASIIAYERMSVYAFLSVLDVVLKLLILFLIVFFPYDRLILYGGLLALVMLLTTFFYSFYCGQYIPICSYRLFWSRSLFKELFGFSLWNLCGSFSSLVVFQGVNFLQNIYYGVIVNAAMGIANQVMSAVYSFSNSFQTAFNPQIVKLYAQQDFAAFHDLIYKTSKYSFFLLLLVAVPLLIFCEEIIEFWFVAVPDFTFEFCKIVIVFSVIEGLTAPLWMGVMASGTIKKYQIVVSGMLLSTLPLGWLFCIYNYSPVYILGVRLGVSLMLYVYRIIYMTRFQEFSCLIYANKVLLPCSLVTLFVFPLFFFFKEEYAFLQMILLIGVIVCYLLMVIAVFGLSRGEQDFLLKKLRVIH